MKPSQIARLLVVFGLSASVTLLVNCKKTENPPKPSEPPPAQSGDPVCSTLTQAVTANCALSTQTNGARLLRYTLKASRESLKVPVEAGEKPVLTIDDALVYNGSLTPERLELRRGDELRVNFSNALSMPPGENGQPSRFADLGKHTDPSKFDPPNVLDMPPQYTNLHTHGLVTAWDFKDAKDGRGDNVLGVLMNSKQQDLPTDVDPNTLCSAGGDATDYRYPISPNHDIGLNWYHPHPHGTSGFQVEGGMSGLLMVADETAEKLLHPTYLQLKDMQTSKKVEGVYQFEKFEPAAAPVCHDKPLQARPSDDRWVFDSDAPGRCNYHRDPETANGAKVDYSWLFMVNGQLFPTIKLPNQAYLRLINSSANATYRLALEPNEVQQQPPNAEKTYYTPPFKVVEKDGTTTVEKSRTDAQNLCTLIMTPSTRVGVALDFEAMTKTGSVCELKITVNETTGADGKKVRKTDYKVEHKMLSATELKTLQATPPITTYSLTQEGIDTGEDDWPSVRLAKIVVDKQLPNADIDAYQVALQKAAQTPVKVASAEVKAPDDACQPDQLVKDGNRINRYIAFFHGGTERDQSGEFTHEHFGLVASGEMNEGKKVTLRDIEKWRAEYQAQFADTQKANSYNTDKNMQEYRAFDLEAPNVQGLVSHKFHLIQGQPIHTNVCTKLSPVPERWRIYNLSAQIHNFHLHQMKFHVVNVRGAACSLPPAQNTHNVKAFGLVGKDGYVRDDVQAADFVGATDEQCVKTYAEMFRNIPATYTAVETQAPLGTAGTASIAPMARTASVPAYDYGTHDTFPIPPMGYIEIDVPFDKPEQVGEYVFHCHILEHEDAGMMGKIVVKP